MKTNFKNPILAISIYYVLCLILHEEVEKPFEWFVANYGNENLSNILNIAFGLILLGTIFFVFKKLRVHPQKIRMVFLWIATLILSYIGYYILMPYKSEGMHFVQYSIMGYLCYCAVGKAWPALMVAYILGICDELYQYIVGGSVYVDFNDMILNFLGSAIGILLFATVSKDRKISTDDTSNRIGWILFLSIIVSVLLFIILYQAGWICFYSDDGCNYSIIKWERGSLSFNFWDCTNWGKCWHRIKVWEGLTLVPLIPLLYFGYMRWSQKLDSDA